MFQFWSLPGPATFVEAVAEDIRQGRSVVVCLPEWHPQGLHQALRSTLPLSDGWMWERIDGASCEAGQPTNLLFARYAPECLPGARRTVWALDQQPSVWGLLLWVDGLTEEHWSAWREFLTEYATVCRQRPKYERAVFCVALAGRAALNPPAEDVCISVRRWSGCVDSLDMLIYTAEQFGAHASSPVQRRLSLSLVAGAALWDPLTSERLAREPTGVLVDPRPVLKDIARERGWEPGDEAVLSWHRGMSDCYEGRVHAHSALLSLSDDTNELNSRIWRAEVSVMLPYIEEQRRDMLSRFGRLLKVPFTTRFGEVITDPFDLELPHIARQIGGPGGGVDFRTRRRVQRMADVRNKLAHLEPLHVEDLDILT